MRWREENRRTRRKILGTKREPTTNSTHLRWHGWEETAYPLRQQCSRVFLAGWVDGAIKGRGGWGCRCETVRRERLHSHRWPSERRSSERQTISLVAGGTLGSERAKQCLSINPFTTNFVDFIAANARPRCRTDKETVPTSIHVIIAILPLHIHIQIH